MDEDDGKQLVYLGAGPIAAILLGIALVPLRGFTTASNFTFLFLALTIVAGEFGGRGAAIGTALSSALSLNFFLTQPYLSLQIHARDDLIAFLGLAGCGVLAAALAVRRGLRAAGSPRQLAVQRAALSQLALAGPLDSRLTELLEAARRSFPLAAARVRDREGRTLAASHHAAGRANPELELEPRTLLSLTPGREGSGIPADGARVPLVFASRPVGWLDLWGEGEASLETRTALVAQAER